MDGTVLSTFLVHFYHFIQKWYCFCMLNILFLCHLNHFLLCSVKPIGSAKLPAKNLKKKSFFQLSLDSTFGMC